MKKQLLIFSLSLALSTSLLTSCSSTKKEEQSSKQEETDKKKETEVSESVPKRDLLDSVLKETLKSVSINNVKSIRTKDVSSIGDIVTTSIIITTDKQELFAHASYIPLLDPPTWDISYIREREDQNLYYWAKDSLKTKTNLYNYETGAVVSSRSEEISPIEINDFIRSTTMQRGTTLANSIYNFQYINEIPNRESLASEVYVGMTSNNIPVDNPPISVSKYSNTQNVIDLSLEIHLPEKPILISLQYISITTQPHWNIISISALDNRDIVYWMYDEAKKYFDLYNYETGELIAPKTEELTKENLARDEQDNQEKLEASQQEFEEELNRIKDKYVK